MLLRLSRMLDLASSKFLQSRRINQFYRIRVARVATLFCIYFVKIIKKSLSLPLMGAVRDTGFDF